MINWTRKQHQATNQCTYWCTTSPLESGALLMSFLDSYPHPLAINVFGFLFRQFIYYFVRLSAWSNDTNTAKPVSLDKQFSLGVCCEGWVPWVLACTDHIHQQLVIWAQKAIEGMRISWLRRSASWAHPAFSTGAKLKGIRLDCELLRSFHLLLYLDDKSTYDSPPNQRSSWKFQSCRRSCRDAPTGGVLQLKASSTSLANNALLSHLTLVGVNVASKIPKKDLEL